MLFLYIFLGWVSCGLIYLTCLVINREKTLYPLINNLNIIKRHMIKDEPNKRTQETLYQEIENQEFDHFNQPLPDINESKLKFYIKLYLKIILFYWIFYLLIIIVGRVVNFIFPYHKD